MTLQVVNPIDVTEAVLTASSIPDIDTSQGEVAWETFEDKYEFTDVTAPNGYLLAFDMIRNDHGELIVVGAAVNNIALVKFDASGALVWSQLIGTDMPSPQIENRFIGIANDGDDLILYFHNNSTGQPNSDKVYRQVYLGLADQGALPSYTVTTNELTGFPQAIKDSDNTRLTESNEVLFAAYNDGYDSSSSVNLAILDKTTGVQTAIKSEALATGRVESIEKDGSGGVYVCARNSIIIQYSAQLERLRLKTGTLVQTAFSQLGFYDGILTTGGRITPAGDVLRLVNLNQELNLTSSYNKGDQVVYLPNNTIYQCLVSGVFSNPSETATGDATAEWIEVSPSNKWRAFDGLVNTKAKAATEITMTFSPVVFNNTIGFIGFSGVSSIRIEVLDLASVVLYDKTYATGDFSAIYDYYSYLFYQVVSLDKLVVTDLPQQPNVTINITISGSNIEIGQIELGATVGVGELVAENTKSDRFSYREQQYNEFGYPTGPAPITVELNTYDVLVAKSVNPAIQKLLNKLTGKNSLWIGDIGGEQKLITYGYFERSPIPFTMPNDINYQITVRASV